MGIGTKPRVERRFMPLNPGYANGSQQPWKGCADQTGTTLSGLSKW